MRNSYKKHYSITAKQLHQLKLINSCGKFPSSFILIICFFLLAGNSLGQRLKINDQGYFETQGVNIFVFSNQYNGMFFDEKTAGIEIIHHGVRTATGGAVRLQNTPEQWDLVPSVIDRKVDEMNNSIEAVLQYKDYDFNSKINVTAKDNGVLIRVYLDRPLPEKLIGNAGFNLEFLPSAYFGKTYIVDGVPGSFPLYPSSSTEMEPLSKKIPQFAGHSTFNDRGEDNFIVPQPL
jgi:endoglucanase